MAPVTRRRYASKKTSCQPIPKNVMVELNLMHNKACMFCGRKEISEKLYGLLYQFNNVVVHYFCILLSSMAVQRGADNQGIWGFLSEDIQEELKRGMRQSCCYCRKKGATISCCEKRCRKVFHLPCGLKKGSMHQYFDQFKSFCIIHRITQTVNLSMLRKSTAQCAICKDAVKPSHRPTAICPPCCKRDAWFHRNCIQDLALNAGYFFKCPLCNNVDEFKSEMLCNGIYIPSRDASWETEPNAFAELTERHSECSIETCLCPHKDKRKYQQPFGSWEILLCNSCGSNGTHRLCSSIRCEQEWCCAVCKEVSDKDEPNNKKIKLEPLINCSGSSGMMSERQVSSHNGEISQTSHRVINDTISSSDSDDSNDSNDGVKYISDDEEQPDTHAVQQQTTQVEQMPPQMQFLKIYSCKSLETGSINNSHGNAFPLFGNQITYTVDLTKDDDDN